jgi:hypothetical protein
MGWPGQAISHFDYYLVRPDCSAQKEAGKAFQPAFPIVDNPILIPYILGTQLSGVPITTKVEQAIFSRVMSTNKNRKGAFSVWQ